MAFLDDFLANKDLSRILVVAIAAQSLKLDAPVDGKALRRDFRRLVRSLDRQAFSAELRQLERLGPENYLAAAVEKLKNASRDRS
jgi:hypothetical protein